MKLLKTLSVLLLTGCITGLASCGGNNPSTGGGNDNPPASESVSSSSQAGSEDSSSETSVIRAVTANEASVSLPIDSTVTIASYYEVEGNRALTAAQKRVTAASSDATVVEILANGRQMKALKVGSATITITSTVDTSKSCTFTITVTDVYFDRTVSAIAAGDDMSQEMPAEGGQIKTEGMSSLGRYYVKGVNSTKWYVETTMTVNSVASSELYPKFGIIADSTSATTETQNNYLTFFLNAEIGGSGTTSWNNFGVCEVEQGNNWAWNSGVTDAVARHKNSVYQNPTPITYGTEVKMAMARDGFDFHLWVNDVYAGSLTVLPHLFGNYNLTDGDVAADCMVGFFHFNSDVTFSEYSTTTEASEVDAKINAVTTKSYITSWDVDAA